MRLIFRGTVQGVGFRPAVYRTATSLGLDGEVRNCGSYVAVDVSDGDLFLERFMKELPPQAKIISVEKEDLQVRKKGFTIADSEGSPGGFPIPADTAVCDRCLSEIMGNGRRSMYPFTTCTDCGPRFTLMQSVPYDRARTTMSSFPMCSMCGKEFSDPGDRRMHHQTICCEECGPKYRLLDHNGEIVEGDPIEGFASLMDEGRIGVVKGWGGMHICCIPSRIRELREWYHRKRKPFAVMVRDIDTLKRYADPTDDELEAIVSPSRPIVLVRKKGLEFSEDISPGLDTIGFFLPYTGMHHILFSHMEHDALIMTSANPPGEPMAIEDGDAMKLGADAYLLHDQDIHNRADDSVLRIVMGNTYYLRKSRGATPSYVEISSKGQAVAYGAQENLVGCTVSDGRICPTQYIGNGEKIGVVEYLDQAIRFNMSLTGCEPSVVAMDLHPGYANRPYAKALAEEYGADVVEIQHHWAHAASLMVEHGIESMPVIVLDGTGHGTDGQAWGGEVLDCDLHDYKRLAHLEYTKLIGGQKAVEDIRRLRFAIDVSNGIGPEGFTDTEMKVFAKMYDTSVASSSMGRLLDSLSYSLGACRERTYDGEPAMCLERMLSKGRLLEGYSSRICGDTICTHEQFTALGRNRPEDEAYSVVHGIMKEMVSVASECSEGKIGLTGGVSYNGTISKMFAELVRDTGNEPIFHNRVPNGDGGISTGQAAIVSEMTK